MAGRGNGWLASAAVLATLAPWCLACATEIHLRRSPGVDGTAGGGAIAVRVFENRGDRGRDAVTNKDVATELYRVEGAAETLVWEGKEPRWSVAELAPGPYVLRATRCVDEWGVVRRDFQPAEARFSVRERETTFADVVLEDPKNAWKRVLAGVVLAGILAYDVKTGEVPAL